MFDTHRRREAFDLIIRSKALLKWYKYGEITAPEIRRSRHAFLLSPHKYGSGCCGWEHYFVLASHERALAIYNVNGFKNPRLRRVRTVPSALMEGEGLSLEQYFAWEDEQAKLNEAPCAPLKAASPPSTRDDELEGILDELDCARAAA